MSIKIQPKKKKRLRLYKLADKRDRRRNINIPWNGITKVKGYTFVDTLRETTNVKSFKSL